MLDQSPARLDQLGLKTGQRPMLHRLRQGQPAQEVAQVVSQYEQREPYLVGNELVTGQPGPVQGVLAFFYPLLCSAPAIVEADYPYGWIAQVGDDEADSGKQFSLMPLHLGYHPSGNIPTLGLVGEVVIRDDGLSGRPLSRRYQQVRYFPLQHLVGPKPDSVADASPFQVLVYLRLG